MFDLAYNHNLIAAIDSGNSDEIRSLLRTWQPQDVAELISSLSDINQEVVFNALPQERAVTAFEYLPLEIQKAFLNKLPSEKAANILNALSPDDRTALLEELPGPVVNELIRLLSTEERAMTLKLLGFPEGSVGRIMTPDYIAVKMDWSIKQVLDFVRLHGQDSETINVLYVIDDKGQLIDDIRIKEFLFASPEAKVSQLSDGSFIALQVTDSQENAVKIFERNNRAALPVVNSQDVLLGIVTIDDILRVSKEEDTEDIQRFGGMEALDMPYMRTPFLELMQKRAGWLVILFVGEMLTATALGYFQDTIAKAVILTLFLPLIVSSGGNSGSQASTLIIRAMALGEIRLGDWWRVMRREVFSGLFLGTVLGALGFVRITVWAQFSDMYGPQWFLIALTVFLSLIGIVLWGTLSGSMLPILLKRLGFDPATSSAPFVATLVDVTGIVIYFSIALVVLQGTLL